jgi:hypothetical protein
MRPWIDAIVNDSTASFDFEEWYNERESAISLAMQDALLKGETNLAISKAGELSAYRDLIQKFRVELKNLKTKNKRIIENGR